MNALEKLNDDLKNDNGYDNDEDNCVLRWWTMAN